MIGSSNGGLSAVVDHSPWWQWSREATGCGASAKEAYSQLPTAPSGLSARSAGRLRGGPVARTWVCGARSVSVHVHPPGSTCTCKRQQHRTAVVYSTWGLTFRVTGWGKSIFSTCSAWWPPCVSTRCPRLSSPICPAPSGPGLGRWPHRRAEVMVWVGHGSTRAGGVTSGFDWGVANVMVLPGYAWVTTRFCRNIS